MLIEVDFVEHDPGNLRVYYRSRGRTKTLYCVQDGEWYLCSKDGEPQGLLKEGLAVKIYDSTGAIGMTKIKRKDK